MVVLEKGDAAGLGGRAASGAESGSPIDNGIKGLILAGTEDEVFARLGKALPANVCSWTNSGKVHMGGRWRDLDGMVLGAFDEFSRVYLDPVKELSYEQCPTSRCRGSRACS